MSVVRQHMNDQGLLTVMNYRQDDLVESFKNNFASIATIGVGALVSRSFAVGTYIMWPAVALEVILRALDCSKAQHVTKKECEDVLIKSGQYHQLKTFTDTPVETFKKLALYVTNVVGPVFSEIGYRVFFQGVFIWAARLVVPYASMMVLGFPVAVSTIVGVVAANVLYAYACDKNSTGITGSRVVSFVDGTLFSIVKLNLGLPAAIAAHIVSATTKSLFRKEFTV